MMALVLLLLWETRSSTSRGERWDLEFDGRGGNPEYLPSEMVAEAGKAHRMTYASKGAWLRLQTMDL